LVEGTNVVRRELARASGRPVLYGDASEKHGVAPHIYESAAEAERLLEEIEGSRR
jgi:hypothetical protein